MYPSDDDILRLIRGCLKDDRRSQEELYRRFYPAMMALCLRYVHGPADAVEVLNDAFLKIFRQLRKYDSSKAGLYTWMRKIVINTALDVLKKQSLIRDIDLMPAGDEAPAIENDAVSKFSADEILGLIGRLPVTTRLVFNLHAIDGFAHREISGMLGIAEGTSRWHLSEARRQLKSIINLMKPDS